MEMTKQKERKLFLGVLCVILAVALALSACLWQSSTFGKGKQDGQIYLYGEQHSNERILKEELRLWDQYYHEDGMRHLFIEDPYYTAEFLNLWMKAEDDSILDELFQDVEGTAVDSPQVKAFYQQIKAACPETVFHGTDVGHQYFSTGQRYLEYLEAHGQKDSEKYALAQENIEQGKCFYEGYEVESTEFWDYRENKMVENFLREYDTVNGAGVMGIYGGAHTGTGTVWLAHGDSTTPCMAEQLREKFGDALHTENLVF